jgi:hypothetical protein
MKNYWAAKSLSVSRRTFSKSAFFGTLSLYLTKGLKGTMLTNNSPIHVH